MTFLRPLALVVAVAFSASANAQIQLQLKEFAEAQSRQVKLAEVVTFSSDVADFNETALGSMTIATMTRINQPLRIDAQLLEKIIARQQPALRGKFKIIGATSVNVTLPGIELPLDAVRDAAKTFLHTELSKQSSSFRIGDGQVTRSALLIPKGELTLTPRLRSGAGIAKKMRVAVDVFVNGKPVGSIPVAVEVDMTRPAYRLKRAVASGATLEKEDYELVEQRLAGNTRFASLLSPDADLSVLRLRQNLAANSILYQENFETAPPVARNQKVRAEFKANGIVVENIAIAKTDGMLGQLIKVADTNSSNIYSAKVIAHGRVEVK